MAPPKKFVVAYASDVCGPMVARKSTATPSPPNVRQSKRRATKPASPVQSTFKLRSRDKSSVKPAKKRDDNDDDDVNDDADDDKTDEEPANEEPSPRAKKGPKAAKKQTDAYHFSEPDDEDTDIGELNLSSTKAATAASPDAGPTPSKLSKSSKMKSTPKRRKR